MAELSTSETTELVTPLTELAFLIARARQMDAAEEQLDEEEQYGEDHPPDEPITDTTAAELRQALEALDDDQKTEVLALVWLGRGDYEPQDWSVALEEAGQAHDKRETAYLMGTPGFGDLLAEGLGQLGIAVEDLEV